MSNQLDSKPQIWKLASDLGLPASGSPTRAILQFVRRRIERVAKQFRCASLADLLKATAADVETVFEEIHSDADLRRIRSKYVEMGETGFANLEADLAGRDDYAITIKRLNAADWDRKFVSVIDCRGEKRARTYFSKWHELAHLLTLTAQLRLVFRRSHTCGAHRDPEERLMDVIAGETGFYQRFIPGVEAGELCFETIDQIRSEFCPESSVQAATIGIVKALPIPCILLEAKPGLKKHEMEARRQAHLFNGVQESQIPLRAIQVTVNDSAREAGIQFHKNWRVPTESVIVRVFKDGGYAESVEDLNWWSTSDGSRLDACPVSVKAKQAWDSVQALIVPRV